MNYKKYSELLKAQLKLEDEQYAIKNSLIVAPKLSVNDSFINQTFSVPIPSNTPTPSVTKTPHPSVTPTPSITTTLTPTVSVTATPGTTVTPTPSITPTNTPTSTVISGECVNPFGLINNWNVTQQSGDIFITESFQSLTGNGTNGIIQGSGSYKYVGSCQSQEAYIDYSFDNSLDNDIVLIITINVNSSNVCNFYWTSGNTLSGKYTFAMPATNNGDIIYVNYQYQIQNSNSKFSAILNCGSLSTPSKKQNKKVLYDCSTNIEWNETDCINGKIKYSGIFSCAQVLGMLKCNTPILIPAIVWDTCVANSCIYISSYSIESAVCIDTTGSCKSQVLPEYCITKLC